MHLLKRLSLCMAFALMLTSCSGKDKEATDPALAANEAPAATTEQNACQTHPDPGPCKAQIEKFYFDASTKKCASFNYGGCQGTVPFETMASCQSACEAVTTSANGCMANGMEYQLGETWTQGCNTCTCSTTDTGPNAVCTNTPCDTTSMPNDSAMPSDSNAPMSQPNSMTPDATNSNAQGT
jgi:hypothetical protein